MTPSELRAFKGRYDLTQAKIARILGLSETDRTLIGKCERGLAQLTEEQVRKLQDWADDNAWRLHGREKAPA
jgi:transcriptional regulator with XRE-family HTH domain